MESEQSKLTPEEEFKQELPEGFVSLPVGESLLEFLDEGKTEEMQFENETKPKKQRVYRVNIYKPDGSAVAKESTWRCPVTILDYVSELRKQNGGTIIGGRLKVKRVGEGKTDTRYTVFLMARPHA